MERLSWFAAVLGLGTLALTGCNSEDARDIKKDVGNLAESGGRALGNAQLVARINATLLQTKGVDVSGLHIESKNGVVTLGGHVRSAEEKRLVEKTTEGIRGVEKVKNDLRIEKK